MAKYTTELRSICEELGGYDKSVGYQSVKEVISKSRDKIFNFEYPIFDNNYRSVLETKIIKHYYTREISAETFGLWQLWLDTRMNEIMPYFNKLYESELLSFNPFYDVDLTTDRTTDGNKTVEGTHTDSGTNSKDITSQDSGSDTLSRSTTDTGSQEGTTTGTSQDGGTQRDSGSDTNKNTRWDIFSDTPQGTLTNVENENYLTNARKITDDGTGTTHETTTTFGKTVTENEDTESNYTRNVNGTETDTYGKKNTTNEDGEHQNTETINDQFTTTEEYLQHIKGKSGGASYARLLMEYRETFLNIDVLIIESLSDLFINLW